MSHFLRSIVQYSFIFFLPLSTFFLIYFIHRALSSTSGLLEFFSALELPDLDFPIKLYLGWVEILLFLLLCIGLWRELAEQGEAQ